MVRVTKCLKNKYQQKNRRKNPFMLKFSCLTFRKVSDDDQIPAITHSRRQEMERSRAPPECFTALLKPTWPAVSLALCFGLHLLSPFFPSEPELQSPESGMPEPGPVGNISFIKKAVFHTCKY